MTATPDLEPTIAADWEHDLIPTAVAHCCRDWVVSLSAPWGSCGLCGQRPTYLRTLPVDQWVRPRPPIRPETAPVVTTTD